MSVAVRLRDGRALSRTEQLYLRAAFWEALSALGGADLYWLPDQRKIAARSVNRPTRRLPEGTLYLGRFFHPFPAPVFVRELDALLADQQEGR